ncbi:hypothetical protein DL89DRAFT_268636, partial [Linderina pennispora]
MAMIFQYSNAQCPGLECRICKIHILITHCSWINILILGLLWIAKKNVSRVQNAKGNGVLYCSSMFTL